MKEIRSRTSKPVRTSERRDSESLRSRKWQHCRHYCYAFRNNKDLPLAFTPMLIFDRIPPVGISFYTYVISDATTKCGFYGKE